jgi:hypothetical protein
MDGKWGPKCNYTLQVKYVLYLADYNDSNSNSVEFLDITSRKILAKLVIKYIIWTKVSSTTLSKGEHAAGGVVVEALGYKPEGRGFDFQLCHWIFSLT